MAIAAFWRQYAKAHIDGNALPIERRLVPLLLMLMLARVDGKSPVEYLIPRKQQFIRDFVYKHLPSPPGSLAGLSDLWFAEMLKSKPFLVTI